MKTSEIIQKIESVLTAKGKHVVIRKIPLYFLKSYGPTEAQKAIICADYISAVLGYNAHLQPHFNQCKPGPIDIYVSRGKQKKGIMGPPKEPQE